MLTLVDSPELSLAEILASLSYALDLTEGQPMGHAVRTCLIGRRIGADLGMDAPGLACLHYSLLMKDAGCSSNAARMYAIFGCDDRAAKQDFKVVDWSHLSEAMKYALTHTLPGGSLLSRARRMWRMIGGRESVTDTLMEARCTRGAQVALSLGLGEEVAQAIRCLDEHWDGRGAPRKLRGEQIPILARIACLAQTLEVFAFTFGVERAFEVARRRAGTWFDPALVRVAEGFAADAAFWETVRQRSREALPRIDLARTAQAATEANIDAVCDAFAGIVDAKSSFTGEHSTRVRDYALEIADGFGFAPERRTLLGRAALLHDIGKLAVPNSILDKPDRLTDAEFAVVKRHPHHTAEILGGITGFERITRVASAHHEKLDGRGYHRGLTGEQLDLDMRILAVADIFDALTARRPYRDALPLETVFDILDKDAGVALDADCIALLKDQRKDAMPLAA